MLNRSYQMNGVCVIVPLSLVYRYRHSLDILSAALIHLTALRDQCASIDMRTKLTRRVRDWRIELANIELNLAERQAELLMIHSTHTQWVIDQSPDTYADFMSLLQLEIEKENQWLSAFQTRKKQTIHHYQSML